jgi:hypothetical protein
MSMNTPGLTSITTERLAVDKQPIGLKLAWSPTGEEVTIAIARGASLQRQHVPVLEGE